MNRATATALLAAAALLLLPPMASAAPLHPVDEELHYRWRLGRFLGVVAGLFLPNEGEGRLTYRSEGELLTTELLITSEHADGEEFWRYGAELDREGIELRRAWSAYRWRGKSNSKSEEVDREGLMDVTSGIWAIRRDPPDRPRPMEIWSDGKIYPVLVIPRGPEVRKIGARKVPTRHFTIRGYSTPDGREWKGRLELWLADDDDATPVEIHIERSLAALQLELVDPTR